jgi:hypothetical protein
MPKASMLLTEDEDQNILTLSSFDICCWASTVYYRATSVHAVSPLQHDSLGQPPSISRYGFDPAQHSPSASTWIDVVGDGARTPDNPCCHAPPRALHSWSPQASRIEAGSPVAAFPGLLTGRVLSLPRATFRVKAGPSLVFPSPPCLTATAKSKRESILSGTASIDARVSRILHCCPG